MSHVGVRGSNEQGKPGEKPLGEAWMGDHLPSHIRPFAEFGIRTRDLRVTVDSCTKSKLVLTLTDGASGGIIYIQGQGAACKQTTQTGAVTHEFDFTSCGIQWESSFKIIVQKKSLYQTGEDKQIPIMCITDLSDITVDNNLNALDKDDDAGQNLTVKPTAIMALYSNNQDVSGGNVQLTDTISMVIQLGSDFVDDFDITAKTCTASTISVIENSCPTDTELFPAFSKPSQGSILASFGAFRTTDLSGGAVTMTFSCTLQVCLGSCAATTCADGSSSYGRKKRDTYELVVSGSASGNDVRMKRQAQGGGNDLEDINVGSSLRITTDEVVVQMDDGDNGICMNKAAFIAGMLAVIASILASGSASIILLRKVMAKKDILKAYESESYKA
ncbi:hypothetical protein FSP39_010654 [Pinctada imbricata]|uniref:ZP domain-containing protein n=1 Tax=Pinctada imbricata TaxID=66713 RepID=A0AA89BUH6_PINIB|nr:hypothetical protein FSP39_010654 [Pinctada imbricata]